MSKVVCPGSFDPITIGHIDVIKTCAEIFEYVYVVVGHNPSKKGMLDTALRVEYAKDAFRDFHNIEVVSYEGLTVDFAHEHNCDVIVKGIRNATDLEYENQMAFANSDISKNKHGKVVQTLYLPANPANMYISSSFVRQLISLELPVDNYVHNADLLMKLLDK